MQPIRVHEKDHWKSVNRRLFSKHKENIQIAYTIELNEKVENSYKGFLKSVKADKHIDKAEASISAYLDFKTTMSQKLSKLQQVMFDNVNALEDHCNNFASERAYKKGEEVNYAHKVDFDINTAIRNDRTPSLGSVEKWAKSLCRHLQEKADIEGGNEMRVVLEGLSELEILADDGYEHGTDLPEAIEFMNQCHAQAGIVRITKPQEVVLPTLLGHDK